MPPKKITIAVTALNAIDSPGPGIAVIRALKESRLFDARIIGLAYETLEPGIYMHELVDKTYRIPFPSAGTEALTRRLEHIHSIEKLDVIIPNFDSELFNFIKLAGFLKTEMGIHTFLPTTEQFEARQKTNLVEFGRLVGVQVPKSKILHSLQEVQQLKNEFSYPLVIKGKFYDASVVYSADQAATAFNHIAARWGLPLIAQEFITGQEVNVTALGDGCGNTIGAVPMRKQYITDKGKAWSGISIQDDALLEITHTIMSATHWRGGLELELIKTEEDVYYLLEINPRFPAWIYLAVGCGQNHPEALVRLALGETVEPYSTYEVGKLFVRYSYDLIVSLQEFEKISTLGEL